MEHNTLYCFGRVKFTISFSEFVFSIIYMFLVVYVDGKDINKQLLSLFLTCAYKAYSWRITHLFITFLCHRSICDAVAYSDSPVCVFVCVCVCYIDYIVNLKNLLVKNHLSNFNQTWQDWSLGEGLPKLFKEFHSMQKSGCHGNQKEL
jgi:hypothetical protein